MYSLSFKQISHRIMPLLRQYNQKKIVYQVQKKKILDGVQWLTENGVKDRFLFLASLVQDKWRVHLQNLTSDISGLNWWSNESGVYQFLQNSVSFSE